MRAKLVIDNMQTPFRNDGNKVISQKYPLENPNYIGDCAYKKKKKRVKIKNIMKRKVILIEESLNEFSKRGRPRKQQKTSKLRGIDSPDSPDSWDSTEDEESIDFDVDTSDMENAEEIEVEDDVFDNELLKALNIEVKLPEYSRRTLKFRSKRDLSKVEFGVPMAKIGDNAFLFKLNDGKLKKFFLKDIIIED